jgi:hypothetical protein
MLADVKPLEQRIGNSPQLVEKKLQEKRKGMSLLFSLKFVCQLAVMLIILLFFIRYITDHYILDTNES